MRTVFADAFYFLALLNSRDSSHDAAKRFAETFEGRLVTTEWVLTEVADALAGLRNRERFVQFLDFLRNRSDVEIVRSSADTFDQGLDLYRARPDKEWTLTDCISISIMERHSISEALTGDRHFEQAGFEILL